MKIRPELLLLKNESIYYKKILVTGSDESLINYMVAFIIKKFKEKNFYIDSTGTINTRLSGDLFSDKKILFVLKDVSLKKEDVKLSNSLEQSLLISSTNNKKVVSLKGEILKSKDSLLIECYALTKPNKEIVIKNFIEQNNISLSGDIFWYLIDNLDNNYVLLEKQLQSLSFFKSKITSVSDIERAVFLENKIEVNKIFFQIFKNNKVLIDLFNKNINSQSDFYIFLNSLKLYMGMISRSLNKEDALIKFPRYLFNERDVFIKIYNCLNKKKIKKIYINILKVETLVRKNSNLYTLLGMRFLINTKKIITS